MAMHAQLSVKVKPMGFLEGVISVIRHVYSIKPHCEGLDLLIQQKPPSVSLVLL